MTSILAERAVSDWQQIDILIAEAIGDLREICLDRVFTEDRQFEDGCPTVAPDGYDPESQGYSSVVEAKGSLPYDTTLSVWAGDHDDISARLKKAARENRIYLADGSKIEASLLKKLKSTRLCASLLITLDTSMMCTAESYELSLLLPASLRGEEILGVVFMREDGSAEFYEVAREGDLLSFETSHFSQFYVIRENTVDLLPWILVLGTIILCEALALVLLYLRRNKRKRIREVLHSVLLPYALLALRRPASDTWILWLLGGIALSLAGWITWLVVDELRGSAQETEYPPEDDAEEPEENITAEEFFEEQPISVLAEAPRRMLLSSSSSLPAVTAIEAEELMTDETAKEELEIETVAYVDPEIYTGTKKTEINIDVISQHFESGDTVTLNALKEKRLVSKNTGYVKILARGILNKPLTVVAQDFSTAALKMILLTGGTPIVTKPSPERSGH